VYSVNLTVFYELVKWVYNVNPVKGALIMKNKKSILDCFYFTLFLYYRYI